MGVPEELIAKLKSKKFGKVTLYFDKDSNDVKVVEQEERYLYVVIRPGNKEVKYFLKTNLIHGWSIDYPIDLHNTWVIRDPMAIDQAEEVESVDAKEDFASMLSDMVYHIVSYDILGESYYKGSDFSNQIIMVLIENVKGKRYRVPYLLDDGVRGGDVKPAGRIMGDAYRFSAHRRLSKNGKFVVSL